VFISQHQAFKKDGTVPPDPVPIFAAEEPKKKTNESGSGPKGMEEEEEEEEEEEKEEQAAPTAEATKPVRELGFVEKFFPFGKFFETAPTQVFSGDEDKDIEKAWGCWRHLKNLFQELEECRPFEIMRNYKDRGNYLISKHAKVIAMTCTHAAIRRGEFVKLGLQYDNLIMEESAQILEIETFIPMLLQEHDKEFGCRLKRVILLGDHHQLPPIIKNMAFQKYSHMDQSLFARFIRLGTPHIQLNAQGRSRASIAKLWNWRYKDLGDLPHVGSRKMFQKANAGFSHEYQFINVEDFQGKGCTTPMPYFYQNLAEAEYIVQTYMYMRLLGYPAHTISILTTYNGQKALMEDIINMRCKDNNFFGRPARISTVDKYQGQQNDYVLLSLVRTKTAGHIRDVRRLVVAMSRARLGLYVFGRESLFKNCFELAPTFSVLLKRPTQLCLNLDELSSLTERNLDDTGKIFKVKDLGHMGKIVHSMAQRAHQNIVQRHLMIQMEEESQKKAAEEAAAKVFEEKKKEFEQMEAQAEKEVETEKTTVDTSSTPAVPEGEEPANDESMEVEAAASAEVPEKKEEVEETQAEPETKPEPEPEPAKPAQEKEKEEPEPAPSPVKIPDFTNWKYKQLQTECRKLALGARGKKAELLKKLQDYYQNQQQ